MTDYSRAEISLRPPNGGPGPLDPAQVVGLAFHWPAMTRPLRGFQVVAGALRGWQAYHMDRRGWSDIAYQVAVDQDGNRYQLRGLRTQSGANGDTDVNERYGAVLLVLAPGEKPTDAMIRTVRRIVAAHREMFPRSKRLVGHNDIRPEPTACPGPAVTDALRAGTFEPTPEPEPFTAATANIEAGLPISKVLADVRTVLRLDPDVIGFQEIGGTARATAMRALLVAKGYRFLRPGGTPDPVAYRRKRFRLLERHRWFLTPETFVGRTGAGPATLREKHGTVQVLEDRKSGQVVAHINAHLAPSIWLGGKREELHTAQVAGLAKAGETVRTDWPDAVLVYTFDGNTDDRARLAPITDLGVRWGVERVTFGARAIDYVGATAEPAGSKAVPLNSDHKALARRFRIEE